MTTRSLSQDELKLIELIYKSAMDFSQWPVFLENLRQHCDAYHANLIFYDAQNRLRNSFLCIDSEPSFRERYLSSFIDLDNQWARRAFSNASWGTAIGRNHPIAANSADIMELMDPALAQYYATEVPYGDKIFSVIFQSNHSQSGISINRHTDHPPFPDSAADILNALGPHLCRATRIHNQLSAVKTEYQQLLDIIEKITIGIALLNSNGAVAFANQEAVRIFESHSNLHIGQGGRACIKNRQQQDRLNALIETATEATQDIRLLVDAPTSMAVYGDHEIHPLKISVLPLKTSVANVNLPSIDAHAVMFITDVNRSCHIAPDYLQLAYGLSPAECDIARLFLERNNIETIAELRGASEATTRTQIKSILSKTGTHSQKELMRILVNLSQDFAIPIA